MASIVAKSSAQMLVLDTRQGYVQQFVAPGWTDLRIGFYISLTKANDDDDPTGLAENLGASNSTDSAHWAWIGLKTAGNTLPYSPGVNFIGYTNAVPNLQFNSQLVSSDADIGDNSNFWRLSRSFLNILQGTQFVPPNNQTGFIFHPVQNPSGAGGYADLIGMRLQRSDANSLTFTVSCKATSAYSVDMNFTNTPTEATLFGFLETWPVSVRIQGPYTLTSIPDSVFCYWPFFLSKLRIHSRGFVKIA